MKLFILALAITACAAQEDDTMDQFMADITPEVETSALSAVDLQTESDVSNTAHSQRSVSVQGGATFALDNQCREIRPTVCCGGTKIGIQSNRGKIVRGNFKMRLVPGLDGGANSVSIQDCSTGKFLRHAGFIIHFHSRQSSDLFKKDASFTLVSSGASAYSFRSVNYPDRTLRHQGYWMKLSPSASMAPAYDDDWTFSPRLSTATVAPTVEPTSTPTKPASVPSKLPCQMKPCQPVCKLVDKVMQFGAFSFPYKAMECGPDMSCISANQACMKILSGAATAAAAAGKALEKQWNAVEMAKADHAKKKAAAADASDEAARAKAAMDGLKTALNAAEAQSLGTAKMLSSAEMRSKKSDQKVKTLLSNMEQAREVHLKAVATHKGAKDAASTALKNYLAHAQAHCTAEAAHAKMVLTLGHGQAVQKRCMIK